MKLHCVRRGTSNRFGLLRNEIVVKTAIVAFQQVHFPREIGVHCHFCIVQHRRLFQAAGSSPCRTSPEARQAGLPPARSSPFWRRLHHSGAGHRVFCGDATRHQKWPETGLKSWISPLMRQRLPMPPAAIADCAGDSGPKKLPECTGLFPAPTPPTLAP
jgi:hypothetical protein